MRARSARRRSALALASVVALSLVATGCAPDASVDIDVPAQVETAFPEPTATQLTDAVTSAMTAAGASGALVGVWAPWSGTLVTGLGTTAVGGGDPVTTDMEFRVAQVTRPMICDVLYAVAAQGTLSVDDSVAQWVPGHPDLGNITLGQLCDGTSGLGSYRPALTGLFLANPSRVWNPRELVSYGVGQPRQAAPGTEYKDSDAAYVLLGVALERATRQSAASLLQTYVFDPLDLTSTRLPSNSASAAADDPAPMLNGYLGQRDGAGVMNCTTPLEVTGVSASTGFTDAGVVSTIDDLGRYAQGLAAGAILPDGVDRFAQPIAVYNGAPSWYTTRGGALQAGTLIGQVGSVPGYSTAAFSDPQSGLTVAVVLNNSAVGAGPIQALAFELAAIASKAPAAGGAEPPAAGLPWTAQQYHDEIAAQAVCAAPAAPAA